ncbi:MAG: OsmC family protein [Bellilinea sp.]
MTQVASKKRLNLRKETVKVTAHFREQGSVLRGDAEAFCDGFEVEVQIESDEPPSTIQELVRLARRMCFTEVALTSQTPITVIATLNGNPLYQD